MSIHTTTTAVSCQIWLWWQIINTHARDVLIKLHNTIKKRQYLKMVLEKLTRPFDLFKINTVVNIFLTGLSLKMLTLPVQQIQNTASHIH